MSIETPPPRRGVIPSQEGAIKVIPKPGDVAVEAPPIETPVVTPPGVNRRRFLAALGGVGLAAAVEATPAARAIVNPFIQNILDQMGSWLSILKAKPVSIEERFPNVLENSEFTSASRRDIEALYRKTQKVDLKNYRGIVAFPIDQETIDSVPNLRYTSQLEAVLPPYIDRKEFESRDVKNAFKMTGLPQGTIIYSPVEGGVVSINIAGERVGERSNGFTPAYTTLKLMFRDSEGRDYSLILSALWGKPLIDNIPPYPEKYSPVVETGAKVGLLQPILELTRDLPVVNREGTALPGQAGQVELKLIYDQRDPRAPIPLTIDFLREPSSHSIIVLK